MASEIASHDQVEVPELTVEKFGQILPVAWRAVTGKDYMPSQEEVRDILIKNDVEIPSTVLDCLHVEFRFDGPIIEEYTDYITSAQEAGIVERANPSMVSVRIKLDPVQAANLVDQFSFDFPAEVDWLKSRIATYNSSAAGK